MILVVGGPTASGKTKVALKLARVLACPFISCDAFQLYEELSIGVNKQMSDFSGIEHYFLDCISPEIDFSVKDYQKKFRLLFEDLSKKHKNIVVCGGTGLYLKASLYNFEFPEEISSSDEEKFASLTNEELFSLLKSLDHSEALKLHPNNRRRVGRAVQICQSSKINKTAQIAAQDKLPCFEFVIAALNKNREQLYLDIDARVEEMWSSGLKEEVITLINKYGKRRHCFAGIGYKEVIFGLENNLSDETIKETIKLNTRHYAKRQMTYFKNQLPTVFFLTEEDEYNYLLEQADGR